MKSSLIHKLCSRCILSISWFLSNTVTQSVRVQKNAMNKTDLILYFVMFEILNHRYLNNIMIYFSGNCKLIVAHLIWAPDSYRDLFPLLSADLSLMLALPLYQYPAIVSQNILSAAV